nr:unnamed protein product [Callosobruchus analis]
MQYDYIEGGPQTADTLQERDQIELRLNKNGKNLISARFDSMTSPNAAKSAAITGLNENLITRLGVILQVLASGYDMNLGEFEKFEFLLKPLRAGNNIDTQIHVNEPKKRFDINKDAPKLEVGSQVTIAVVYKRVHIALEDGFPPLDMFLDLSKS